MVVHAIRSGSALGLGLTYCGRRRGIWVVDADAFKQLDRHVQQPCKTCERALKTAEAAAAGATRV